MNDSRKHSVRKRSGSRPLLHSQPITKRISFPGRRFRFQCSRSGPFASRLELLDLSQMRNVPCFGEALDEMITQKIDALPDLSEIPHLPSAGIRPEVRSMIAEYVKGESRTSDCIFTRLAMLTTIHLMMPSTFQARRRSLKEL